MTTALLMATWLVPVLLAPLVYRRIGRWLTVAAPVPALATAWSVTPGTSIDLPWLLLGTSLGLDTHAPLFLGFSSVLWLAASLYGVIAMSETPNAGRFRVFFLLAMSGNFGLIVGQDLISFYMGFSLMGLAAYALIVHDGNPKVERAGRIYLIMAVAGEIALFVAFVLIFDRTDSLVPTADQLAGSGLSELAMLTLAFGIKAGLMGLHMWLPLAHPAAPVAASAVLSGAMIKAALIGWMRYLPLGQQQLAELGTLMVVLGGAGTLIAVLLGLMQRDPKVVLAYSSVGKMGTLIAGIGTAALTPTAAPALAAALALYAAHHGLAKGALFLGVGVVKSSAKAWPWWVLLLPALVLVGIPFSSGAMAKDTLKLAMVGADPLLETALTYLLTLGVVGTTLLLVRFAYLVRPLAGTAPVIAPMLALPWLLLISVSLLLPLQQQRLVSGLSDALPLLVALFAAWVVMRTKPAWLSEWVGRVAPGDILGWFSGADSRSSRHV